MTSVRAAVFVFLCVSIGSPVCANNNDLFSTALNFSLPKCQFSKSKLLDVSAIDVYIYDFTNKINSTYYINSQDSVNKITGATGFQPSYTHFFYVPGFTETVDSINDKNLLDNMQHAPNTYIYIFNHHNYTNVKNFDNLHSYERAVSYYWSIGRAIALFIKRLVGAGVPLKNCIVAGHSLGGQVVGAVGEAFVNETGKKLPRIIGTDPAGPCFTKAPKEYQLRSGVAEYTETYHCNKGYLGTTSDFTDATYYVNGGVKQPGCKTPNSFMGSVALPLAEKASGCNHNSCPVVLSITARVKGIWTAKPCNSGSDCEKGVTRNSGTTTAGVRSPATNKGSYYIDTTGYKVTPS